MKNSTNIESLLRAAHRAGMIKGHRMGVNAGIRLEKHTRLLNGPKLPTPTLKYHRTYWDNEPLRAQLGFGPKAKQ